MKERPYDDVKWSFTNEIDPLFEGVKEVKVKREGFDKLDAEIKTSEPKLIMNKWDKEVSLKVSYPSEKLSTNKPTINMNEQSKRVLQNYGDVSFDIYQIDNNSMEYLLILNQKPDTNSFDLELNYTEGLEFNYQAPLYKEQGLTEPNATCNATDCQGSHRPENVVGSYAVYHNYKRNNQYKTGKLFHIYRPKIFDANNKTVWGTLDYSQNKLTVTVPQDFLDKASYPVRVDPSFGYDTAGSSYERLFYEGCCPSYLKEQMGTNHSVNSSSITTISCHMNLTGDGNITIGYYEQNGNSQGNHSLINDTGATDDISIGWNHFGLGGSISSNNSYILAISAVDGIASTSEIDLAISYDDTGATGFYLDRYNTNETHLADPFVPDSNTSREYSIYANYTLGNSAPDSPLVNAPSDGATGVSTSPDLNVTVTDDDGDDMNVSFYGGTFPVLNCYQEFANVSDTNAQETSEDEDPPIDDSCSLNYSGTYAKFNGTRNLSEITEVYDGNWSDDNYIYPSLGDWAEWTINYTKPELAVSAIWQVKDNSAGYGIKHNYTIPSSCWSQEPLQLRVCAGDASPCDNTNIHYCYNGSAWEQFNMSWTTSYGFTEEAIYWQGNYSQISSTQTGIANGSTAQVTWSGLSQNTTYFWYVNVTDGTDTTQSSIWNFTTISGTADITCGLNSGITFNFPCDVDSGTSYGQPVGQTGGNGAIWCENNGTLAGDFKIKLNTTPAAGWSFMFNSSDVASRTNLTDSWQTWYSSVGSGENYSIWLWNNCSVGTTTQHGIQFNFNIT